MGRALSHQQKMDLNKRLYRGAVSIIQPKPDCEIWEFVEKNIRLNSKITTEAGPVRFRQYQKGKWSPLWAFKRYRRISNIWGTQLGKTLLIQMALAYVINNDPGPAMFVFPTEITAKKRSKGHLKPLIEECCSEFTTGNANDLATFEYMLINMKVNIAWAGSPANLASEPVRYLFLDEKAKYRRSSEKEADPESLARERTTSYGNYAREFDGTTPTTEEQPGWNGWTDETTQCQNYVPCHNCKKYQVMYFNTIDQKVLEPENDTPFEGGIQFDRDQDISKEKRIMSAHYVCRFCGCPWNDYQRLLAIDAGEWVPKNEHALDYTSHLPSWYAPRVPFSEIVRLWFKAFRNEDDRHNIMNSKFAIPYQAKTQKIEPSVIRKHILPGLNNQQVRPEASQLILTADIHKSNIRYRVRAWDSQLNSWGVAEGKILPLVSADGKKIDITPLEGLVTKLYGPNQQPLDFCIIDSGWHPDSVYRFCLRFPNFCWPANGNDKVKGIWQSSYQPVFPNPQEGLYEQGQVQLLSFNTHRMQNELAAKLQVPLNSPGAWFCEEEISDIYCHEMCGKALEEMKAGGGVVARWVEVGTYGDHARDTEIMQLLGVTVFPPSKMEAPPPPKRNTEAEINPITNKPYGEYQ